MVGFDEFGRGMFFLSIFGLAALGRWERICADFLVK